MAPVPERCSYMCGHKDTAWGFLFCPQCYSSPRLSIAPGGLAVTLVQGSPASFAAPVLLQASFALRGWVGRAFCFWRPEGGWLVAAS